MTEIKAFDLLLIIAGIGHAVMITFPFAGPHIYIANFFISAAACGMFSAWMITLEKRVPAKNSGTILLLARTLSVGVCAASPSIATLSAPEPHIITLALCVISFITLRTLPPAGCYSKAIEGNIKV